MEHLVSVEDHLAVVLRSALPVAIEKVALESAHGRILREALRAAAPIPAFENSAMDGFAVRFAEVSEASEDRPAALRVCADLAAGASDDPPLPPGTAVRIMTGAPMPSEADTVVPFEHTVDGLEGSLMRAMITRSPRASGANVRRVGEDIAAGDEIVASGTTLRPLHQAAIAASGIGDVHVSRVVRVAVISTGSELVEPGEALGRGRIPESNGRMLASLAVEEGCRVVCLTTVPDEGDRLLAVLSDVTTASSPDRADIVLFSGGVSAGAFEVVKQALAGRMNFSRIALRPGKPQGFGRTSDGVLLFGLPGNPVSAAVSFEVFVRPALLQMQGRVAEHRPSLLLPVTRGWRSPAGMRQYVPVSIDRSDPSGWKASPSGSAGSHGIGALASSGGYAVVPEDVCEVEDGHLVRILLTS
ncbi:molybdopterin molybdotransferase MoeA [Microbacterium sp. LMI11-1-1.1]